LLNYVFLPHPMSGANLSILAFELALALIRHLSLQLGLE
jgi:hypothetical protein